MRLLVFFLILFSSYGLAQEPVLLQLTTADGLPDNEIYEIREDHKGFVWIASNKGLIRYDGTEFVKFTHPDQRGLSVFEPFVDDDNRVWCMNISGQIFYAQNSKMHLYADLKKELNGSLASINVVNDFLVISMYKKNIVYNLTNDEQQITDRGNNLANYGIPNRINDNIYWSNGNYVYELEKGLFQKKDPLPANLIALKDKPDPILLVPTNQKSYFLVHQKVGKSLLIHQRLNNSWQSVKAPESLLQRRITSVYYLHDELWFLTDKGIFNCTLAKDELVVKNRFLKDNFTTALFEDADLNLWVSTLRNGIIIIPNIHVKKISLPDALPTRLEKVSDSTVLIGFESGDVINYDVNNNTFNTIDLPTSSGITALHYYNNQSFLFQKTPNYTYNHSTGKVSRIKNRIANVKQLKVTGEDTLILANSGSVIKTTLKNNAFTLPEDHLLLHEKRGYAVLHHPDSNISYYATVDGLLTFNKDGTPQEIKTSEGNSILTRNLIQGKNGVIWVGTFTNGIYKIKATTVIDHLNSSNGLNSNVINSMTIDGDYLWVATDQSLERINTINYEINKLNEKDGIPEFSIRDMTVLGDELVLNTSQNVYAIDKNLGFKPLYIPDYYFTDVVIDGVTQAQDSIYDIPDQDVGVIINYHVNGWRGLSNGNFEYRIKDNTSWTTQPQGSNTIQFASLPTGDIEFQLRQSGSEKIKTLYFSVHQVFYKNVAFWVIVAGLLIGGIVVYYKRLLRFRESVKNEELKKLALDNELISLKLENLRSQMNPHFIFNALNSIQEYIVSNEKNLASSYLVKFSRLIRMYLDQSRDNEITLAQELDAMQLYLQLEKVRFEDKLIYDIQVDPNIKTDTIKVPPLFIQPYVENALKHGLLHKKQDRNLSLDFNLCDDKKCLEVIIIDNGIGREASQEIIANRNSYHKSFATHANIERVELLNRKRKQPLSVEIIDLKDHKNSATGTEVRIIIPQEL